MQDIRKEQQGGFQKGTSGRVSEETFQGFEKGTLRGFPEGVAGVFPEGTLGAFPVWKKSQNEFLKDSQEQLTKDYKIKLTYVGLPVENAVKKFKDDSRMNPVKSLGRIQYQSSRRNSHMNIEKNFSMHLIRS